MFLKVRAITLKEKKFTPKDINFLFLHIHHMSNEYAERPFASFKGKD